MTNETAAAVVPMTCVYPMLLSTADTERVVAACKRRQVSVQSAIQTAGVIAMCQMISAGAIQHKIPVHNLDTARVNCMAGLRGNIGSDYASDVSYVASHFYAISQDIDVYQWTNDKQFWKLAEQTQHLLRTKSTGSMKSTLYLNNLLNGHATELPPFKRTSLLSFTNLGQCDHVNDAKCDASVQVVGNYNTSSGHGSGPVFGNSVMTIKGRMNWGVMYYTNVTPTSTAKQYLERSVHILLDNCTSALEIREKPCGDNIR